MGEMSPKVHMKVPFALVCLVSTKSVQRFFQMLQILKHD